MARALAAEHDVVLASTVSVAPTGLPPAVRLAVLDARSLPGLTAAAGVVVLSGDLLTPFPELVDVRVPVVVDAYDPAHLELLEQARDGGEDRRRAMVAHAVASAGAALARADLVLCASERQRDLWLGHLGALGRVNPATYDADPTLRALVAVVPFGLPDAPPVRRGPGPRELVPGIGPTDPLLLWAGGIYNWFDPEVLVRAVARLRTSRPDVRLLFLGGRHPNPAVPAMRAATAARALAAQLDLAGTVVFADGWVPYDERADWLLQADVGVSTHHDAVETAYSYRTRLLDHVWTALPTVATGGDALSELLHGAGAGLTVPAGDEDALVAALDRLLGDPELRAACSAAARRLAPSLAWSRALEPLLAFCRDPRRAPDLVDPAYAPPPRRGRVAGAVLLAAEAARLVREQGLRAAARRANTRTRRLRSLP